MVNELQIYSTKYLQELVPLIYSVLTNPFGTAYLPLLLAATTTARAVILNAYPRVWRWRGEILGAICSCWLHVLGEEKRIAESKDKVSKELGKLKKQLRGVVYLLKLALLNPVPINDELDAGQSEAREKIDEELHGLVKADDELEGLLLAEINPDDTEEFF